jgi:hypothetical protein
MWIELRLLALGPLTYFAAAHVKFAASFVSPLPLYFAAFG